MRSNMTIYEGAFVNTETNIANENIQQLIIVRLFDTETVVTNAYNIRYRAASNGDGTQTVYVTWEPGAAAAASFGYNNGGWIDTVIDLSGTAIINIPEGDWTYSMVVDSVRIELGEGETIPLEMADTPLKISAVDNDEDKFTTIRSKQAKIQIHSSDQVDISDFAEGGDNRWYVEIETQAEGIIFKGFLSISDLEQEFLPDPNIILLTSTDGLGFLNDEPLVNFDNETPTGVYPIINFLAWALAKTGLSLDIKACMNIRERYAVPLVSDDSGAGHFYTHEYLDAKTFEAEIGVCEDCFTVIQKILGENSFLTQYKGKWIIVRIDELETGHEYFFTRFDHEGNWIENTEETYTKNIGVGLPLSFMNDDALVSLERPYKSIVLTFKYAYPEEAVCNIEFERGDVITEPDLTAENSEGTYELDCWTKQKFPTSGTTIIPADNDAYIKRLFELGYEKERYLVLTTGPAAANEGVMSEPVAVNEKDRIAVSVDWRLASNVGSGDGRLEVKAFNVLIISDAGQYYYLDYTVADTGGTDPAFWTGPFSGQRNQAVNYSWIPSSTDETTWANLSATAPPAPVSGRLYVGLFKEWQGSGVYEVDTYFTNLNIDIVPLINGSYAQYTGQTHTVLQANNKIKAVRETEVFISDAPRIAMKGALLKAGPTPGVYILTEGFYNAAKLPAGVGAESDVSPFGQIQAFDVWNQFNRVMRTFEGTIDRTDSTTELPDLLHKYILKDISQNTTTGEQYRIFQLLHFEMDMHLCEWDEFLIEVFNTDIEKVYDDHQFKYLTRE